jgi:hypothetical protein
MESSQVPSITQLMPRGAARASPRPGHPWTLRPEQAREEARAARQRTPGGLSPNTMPTVTLDPASRRLPRGPVRQAEQQASYQREARGSGEGGGRPEQGRRQQQQQEDEEPQQPGREEASLPSRPGRNGSGASRRRRRRR